MNISVKVSDEQYKIVKKIAKDEDKKINKVIEIALRNYFISKKITAWDKLSENKQKALKNKAKALVK